MKTLNQYLVGKFRFLEVIELDKGNHIYLNFSKRFGTLAFLTSLSKTKGQPKFAVILSGGKAQ